MGRRQAPPLSNHYSARANSLFAGGAYRFAPSCRLAVLSGLGGLRPRWALPSQAVKPSHKSPPNEAHRAVHYGWQHRRQVAVTGYAPNPKISCQFR